MEFWFSVLLVIVPFIVGISLGLILIFHDADLPVAMIVCIVSAFASTFLLYWIFHETAGFEIVTNRCSCGEVRFYPTILPHIIK